MVLYALTCVSVCVDLQRVRVAFLETVHRIDIGTLDRWHANRISLLPQ